jgi:hypothetical protein
MIKVTGIHIVSDSATKYIILCKNCDNNFPWCSSLIDAHRTVIYSKQLAIGFISSGLEYTAYSSVFNMLGMKPLSSNGFDHIKTQWYDVCISLKEKIETENRIKISADTIKVIVDFAWDHRKNAENGVLTIVESESNNVILLQVI